VARKVPQRGTTRQPRLNLQSKFITGWKLKEEMVKRGKKGEKGKRGENGGGVEEESRIQTENLATLKIWRYLN